MTTALAWLGVVLGALVGAGAAMTLVGWCLPRHHQVARTLLLPVPPAAVWETLVDYPGQVTWRRGLTAVTRQPDRDGAAVWRERRGRHALDLRTVAATPPRHLVRQIGAEDGPLRGQWEWALEPVVTPASTRLTLTERGEVGNPLVRFVNRFVIGQGATATGFLRDLARRFGTEPRFIPSLESQREADAPRS